MTVSFTADFLVFGSSNVSPDSGKWKNRERERSQTGERTRVNAEEGEVTRTTR